MATPESELYDLLKDLFDNVNANVSGYGGLGIAVIGGFFLLKFVTNRLKKKGSAQTADKPSQPEETAEESSGGGGENAGFRILFPYSIFFLVLAFVLTFVIKTPRAKKTSVLNKEVLDFDK